MGNNVGMLNVVFGLTQGYQNKQDRRCRPAKMMMPATDSVPS